MLNKKIFNTLENERSERADELHQIIKAMGIGFATGVPCGVLRHIIKNIEIDKDILHMPANRESEAIGIAAGAYFSGKNPVVYMQNSGLFAASNDIASLLMPYKIPVFLIVSYRGCMGEDAVQHFVTGRATEILLKSFSLPFEVYENQDLSVLLEALFEKMKRVSLPAVLLLKRGWDK